MDEDLKDEIDYLTQSLDTVRRRRKKMITQLSQFSVAQATELQNFIDCPETRGKDYFKRIYRMAKLIHGLQKEIEVLSTPTDAEKDIEDEIINLKTA